MNIVVCIKQVPDTAEVKIDPVTNNLVRTGIPAIMNPCDRTAVETALEIKKKLGGRVTVVSMGPEQAKAELEKALAMGADEAFLLSDRKFVGADTLATAGTLAGFLSKNNYDLVLCGAEAIDGSTGQVGPGIGEKLGIPAITYVQEIRAEENRVVATRNSGSFLDTYEVKTPCVVCVLKQQPKLQEGKATSLKISIVTADNYNEDEIGSKGSPTKVVSIKYGKGAEDFLWVDYSLSLEERMEYIFNGGLELKEVSLIKKSPEETAGFICEEIRRKEVPQSDKA